jgi:uncharacterized paraquat-inducible protein A
MFPYDFETRKWEKSAISEREMAEKETVEPQKTPLESEEPKEELIRFTCACGKRVKVPAKYAGKTARCPRCKNRVKIPEK